MRSQAAGLIRTDSPIDDLLERLLPSIEPVQELESVSLRDARGRVLGRTVAAEGPVPGFRRSAVDGYALCLPADGAATDLVLPVVGYIAAGAPLIDVPPTPGAIRIFTGAPVPRDFDRVAMQEDCLAGLTTVPVRRVPKAGANVRQIGDDIAAGQVALSCGTQLDGRHLAVAASLGLTNLRVRRRIRIGVLSTGSELVSPGQNLGPGKIYASNGVLVTAILEQAGFDVVDLGIVEDDPDCINAALNTSLELDALVTSGGVSVGESDYVRRTMVAAGGKIEQWRLPIKPGKPILFGRLPRNARSELPVIGLPGNPNAAFVTLVLIGLPLLRAVAGQPRRVLHPILVEVQASWRHAPGRQEFVPVQLLPAGLRGIAGACRAGSGGSAQQCALSTADALAIVPAEADGVAVGDVLAAYPINQIA